MEREDSRFEVLSPTHPTDDDDIDINTHTHTKSISLAHTPSLEARPTPTSTNANPTSTFDYRWPSPSYPSYTLSPFRPRQQPAAQTTGPSATSSSSSFDFWWPFPLATTTTTTTTGSTVALASSSSGPTPSLQAVNSTSLLGTSASSSSTSSSSASSPSITPPASNSKPPFTLTVLIPTLSAAGLFLLILSIWLVYGCCTRKPRVRRGKDWDDAELVCGPPYSSIPSGDEGCREVHGDVHRRDVERRGWTRGRGRGRGWSRVKGGDEDEEEEEEGKEEDVCDAYQDVENKLIIPKRGLQNPHRRVPASRLPSVQGKEEAYRWPSYNDPPPFDTHKGFYIPDEYNDSEGENGYLKASLLVPPVASGKTVGERGGGGGGREGGEGKRGRAKSKRSVTSRKSKDKAGPSNHHSKTDTLSPRSDNTSIALLELYSSASDTDKEREVSDAANPKHPSEPPRSTTARKAKLPETPWESLRHKSIKRGILEKVKREEDKRGMDSVRGGVGVGIRTASVRLKDYKEEQELCGLLQNGIANETENRKEGVEEVERLDTHRKAHRQSMLDVAGLLGQHPETPTTAVGRRTYVQLKDDPQDLDRYTRVPTRKTPSRSRSRSRSGSRTRSHTRSRGQSSTSPLKIRPSRKALHHTDLHRDHRSLNTQPAEISRDVLPTSPPQLMSPPLESQICFTPPLPALPFRLNHVRSGALKDETTTAINATKRKSRKLHSHTPPRLPFPGTSSAGGGGGGGGGGMTSPHPDLYRGRLVKKKMSGKEKIKDDHGGEAGGEGGGGGDKACKDAMRKVDEIIQSSWSARDLV